MQKILYSAESSGICAKHLLHPDKSSLNHLYDVPTKLTALVCLVVFGTKAFCSLAKRAIKTENLFRIFAVKGVINSENWKSFIKLPF